MSETQSSNKIEFFKTMLLKSISVGHSENKAIELIKISAPKNNIELLESDVNDIKLIYLDLKSNKKLRNTADKIENYDESSNRNEYLSNMLKEGFVFADIKEEYNYLVLDDKIEQVSGQRLSQMQQSFGVNIAHKIVYAKRFYSPRQTRIGQDENGIAKLNSYVPPMWAHNNYFFGKNIEDSKLPKCYSQFFTHLFPNEASKEYMLDWIANSLRRQNQTYLILIGEKGIGKNIFSQILRKVHGEMNALETSSKTLNGEFNAELSGRTLVCFDELQLSESEIALDRFKSLVNPQIRIEGKGQNAEFLENFLNVVVLSNRDSAIPLEDAEDRRYSFLDLTEVPLRNAFENLDNFIVELLKEENIEALAKNLWNRKITHNMLQPFSSDAVLRILESQRKDWEQDLLTRPKVSGQMFEFMI